MVITAILVTIAGISCGFANPRITMIEEAQRLIQAGQAKCVLINDSDIIALENGRGVSPLLTIYETHHDQMAGATVVDKVVGRAAAAIAICGGVSHVHGELMSEDAVEFLEQNGVTVSYTKLVPRILNQKLDGLCPLEQSVLGIEDPVEALAALKIKVAELAAGAAPNAN